MTRVMPTPQVFLGGGGGLLNTTGDGKTNAVIDDYRIEWGRRAEDENVVASTATVRIWVPNADLSFLAAGQIVGQDMILSWVVGSTLFVTFQGRVTSFTIAEGPRPGVPAALSVGFIVTVTGSDRIADLTNIEFGPNTLSHDDTLIIRANLIKNNANGAGVGLNGVYFEPQTTGWKCGIYPTQGTNLRQWVDAFYMALGNWWTFCHDQATLRPVRRWANPAPKRWYAYDGPGSASGIQMVTLRPDNVTYDSVTYESAAIPGREAWYEGERSLDSGTSSRVNYIAADHKDAADGDQTKILDQSSGGRRRTMRYTSWLSDGNTQVAQVNNDLYVMYAYNMVLPKLPPITFDTSRHGGFLSLAQAKALTRAYENPGEIAIGGGALTAIMNANTVVQANGGVIRYVRDHWEITINPKWCGNNQKQNAVRWDQLPAGGWSFDHYDPGLTGYDFYDITQPGSIWQGED